ncbi:Dihydroxyacetone phosphate acyltransferase [Stagonosporopsis vannaccii]|nr:Dihydroxyacetone phosphate acyltransferase [Stagonosporopsis vannaccii]
MADERQSTALPPAQPSYILRGHASQVHSVQFVRQNTRLITGDADGWVIYWKLETKRALAVWKAHDGAILGTAEWAHDKIITHGRDNNLRIWQIRTGEESALSTALPAEEVFGDRPVPWLLHTLPVNTLNFCAFSMCYASQGRARGNEGVSEEARRSDQEAYSIMIAVPARDDKKAEVYQFPEEKLRYVVPRAQPKDTGMVMAIKLVQSSPAQRMLVITGYEGGLTAVHVLPQDDGSAIGLAQLVYLSQPHTQPILSLDVSPDANAYFTSGADAIVAAHRLPNLPSRLENDNAPRGERDGEEQVVSVQNRDDNEHASLSAIVTQDTASAPADDPPISIPDDNSDKRLSFSKRPVTSSTLSEHSDRKSGGLSSLLSGHTASSVTAEAAPQPVLSTPSIQAPYRVNNTKHAGQQSLTVRSDGRVLATGGWDSRVRIYSTKTLKELAVLKWHKQGVYAVAFAGILDARITERHSEGGGISRAEGLVTRKETGLSKLQREREEKMQVKHWIAAGAKDGKLASYILAPMTTSKDRKRPLTEAATSEYAPDLSITAADDVHLHAIGYNESPDRGLINSYARFRSSPLDFIREVSLQFSGTGWRSFDNHVGQPEFYSGFSEDMKTRVLNNPMLVSKVRELAEGRVRVEAEQGLLGVDAQNGSGVGEKDRKAKRKTQIEESLMQVSETWTDGMICKMESKNFIRGAYYLATQLLTRAYHQGVHVSSEEVLRLRTVAAEAARKKHSIIFLPCHRSHVDYVSLQIICYRLGLALPTVVAGDNLNFPVVGSFLQHAGAMWIRRSFGDDQLYTTLVQAYIDTLLQCGYNLECFVEGGRSRTGKLLPPKFGILSYMLDSVASRRVNDAIICPVSTQYDKVIEVDSYISELLGQPKPKENLMDFLSSSSVLSLKLGRVDVRFHEPWSLRTFIDQQRERASKLPQQLDSKEDRIRLLRTLGYKVLSEINDVSVVMPTALVGTVLLTLRGRGVGKTELIRRVEWLCDRVRAQGGRVAHFGNLPTSVVVDRALEVLGPGLVGLVPALPEDTYYAVDRFQLSFYRNMTIHLFILQSLVSAALYTTVKRGGAPESQRMSYTDLHAQVGFLSQLFRGEFIFPTEGLDFNLARTIAGLETDNVVKVTRNAEGVIDYVELSDKERETGRENFDFYCFLIWPFIEAAWLGTISLMMLTPPLNHTTTASFDTNERWLDMKRVQDRSQLLGKTLYHQGDLSYYEAVNKETLKNSYTRFEEEGMIVVAKSKNTKTPTTIRLAEEWTPVRGSKGIIADGPLWRFAERISASRREGKNRRDGATVQTRVLSLVDFVGQALWAGDVLDAKSIGREEVGAAKKKAKGRAKRGSMARL